MKWFATIDGQSYEGTTWLEAAWRAFAHHTRARKAQLQRWDSLGDGRSALGYVGTVSRAKAAQHFTANNPALPS